MTAQCFVGGLFARVNGEARDLITTNGISLYLIYRLLAESRRSSILKEPCILKANSAEKTSIVFVGLFYTLSTLP